MTNEQPRQIANSIIMHVSELSDRTSPGDQPGQLLVTADELRDIIVDAISEHMHFLEAEQRGAEEQRRKDAAGQYPVGYASKGGLAHLATKTGVRVQNLYGFPDNAWPIPLYTRPANASALEAENEGLKEAEHLVRADAEASAAREEILRAENDRLREYYAAAGDVLETGILNADAEQFDRLDEARAVLASDPAQGGGE